MYVWRMEKIMAKNFREWKMLQQYDKYRKGRTAAKPEKEGAELKEGAHSVI